MAFLTIPGSNMCAFELSVGFGSVPGTSTVSWTDVSPYVRSVQTRRGRTRELDTFQTGTMTFVLNNSDRRFDPTYVSTPYGTTNLVPMVPVRFRTQYNSVTYDTFYGYVTGWPQSYPDRSNHYAESTVVAVDGFEVLAATTLPDSLYEMVVGTDQPAYWWRLNDVTGSEKAADSGYTSPHVPAAYRGFPSLAETAILGYDGGETCIELDGATQDVFVQGTFGTSFTFECWVKIDTLSSGYMYVMNGDPGGGTNIVVNGSGAGVDAGKVVGTILNSGTSAAAINDGNAHHIVLVSPNPTTGTLYVDGVAVSTGSGSGAPQLQNITVGSGAAFETGHYFDGWISETALYTTQLTAAQVLAHYQAGALGLPETTDVRLGRVLNYCGWSTSARSLDTGSTTVMGHSPSGTGLDYANTLAKSETAGFYVNQSGNMKWRARQSLITVSRYINSTATFSDAAGGLQYRDFSSTYDRTEIFNDVRTTRSGGISQVAQSTASIASYLRRTSDSSGLVMSNDNEALARSQYLLYKKKDPQYQVSGITIQPQSDPANLWPQVLGRELEDKVTVVRTPVNLGSAITQPVRIQSVAHSVFMEAGLWETDLELSPVSPDSNWWIWDTSTWSGSTTSNPAVWGY